MVVSSALFKRTPLQVLGEEVGVRVVSVDALYKASTSALDFFILLKEACLVFVVGVGILRQVPDRAGVLHLGDGRGLCRLALWVRGL